MSAPNDSAAEQFEIELLLPWYVTGKLDAADRARVEAFLATHPEMQRQLELTREEREQAILANEKVKAPSLGTIDQVMASVAGKSRPAASARRVWDMITNLLGGPAPGGVRWAAAAAVFLLLAQAAVIGALLIDRRSDPYQVAGGKQAPAGGTTLLVGFADQATAPAIAALLSEFDAQIIEGPKPGGMYRIRLGKAPATSADRDSIMRRLLARQDVIKLVLRSTD